jgi:hypothetical protein
MLYSEGEIIYLGDCIVLNENIHQKYLTTLFDYSKNILLEVVRNVP